MTTQYCTQSLRCIHAQEEAVLYVATTVDRLLKEQQQQGLKRVYVISTYVIGKERLLIAIYKLTGCKIGVTQQKMDTMKCLDLPGKATQCLAATWGQCIVANVLHCI